MGVMPCECCGQPMVKNVIEFETSKGSTYIRLCNECFDELKYKSIGELLEDKNDDYENPNA